MVECEIHLQKAGNCYITDNMSSSVSTDKSKLELNERWIYCMQDTNQKNPKIRCRWIRKIKDYFNIIGLTPEATTNRENIMTKSPALQLQGGNSQHKHLNTEQGTKRNTKFNFSSILFLLILKKD